MVLSTRRLLLPLVVLLAVFGLLALGGCLSRAAVVRLTTPERVLAVWVLEPADRPEVLDAGRPARSRVGAELTRRNFVVEELPFARTAADFTTRRSSAARYAALESLSDAPARLLIEARAQFDAQLGGRFRWSVAVRLWAGRRGAAQLVDSFDVPVFLEYAHEREREALDAAAPVVASRLGALLDRLIGGSDLVAAVAGANPLPVDDAIYFVLVDRFADGDADAAPDTDRANPHAFHGGDLRGLRARLDHIQAMGFRTVWLSPVTRSRQQPFLGFGAYHGYWPDDLLASEPRFGDEAELVLLARELERRGMRLLLDLVVNHVAPDAPLVAEHPDWFHHEGPVADFDDPVQRIRGELHGLPDLAQERDEVYAYLLRMARGWIARVRPAGFRLDAVKHAPDTFWRRFTTDLHASAGPGFFLLGEILDGDPARLAHAANGSGFDAVFDFPLAAAMKEVFCEGAAPAQLGVVLAADRGYDASTRLVTLVDNHDLPRIMGACGGNRARVEQALAFLFTARGVPSVAYGTEAGLAGLADPDNRASMPWAAPHPLRAAITTLLAARHAHPALQTGVPLFFAASPTLFAYARVSEHEAAVIGINSGAAPVDLRLPAALDGHGAETTLHGAGELTGGVLRVPAGELVALLLPAAERGGFAELAAQIAARASEPHAVRFHSSAQAACRGEALLVVGSAPELGAWRPEAGLLLNGTAAPTATVALPAGVIAFKLVRRTADGSHAWEPGPNRYFLVAPEGRADVELDGAGAKCPS